MLRPLALSMLTALLLGCQAPQPKFETRKPEGLIISGYPFEKIVAKDTFGSRWKLVELRPARLPYTGAFAKLSAQDRWNEILKVLDAAISDECKGGPTVADPEYRGDQSNFAKAGSSPRTPKYAQAKFMCK
jgi:hypothetical protein